ncbi:MAG: guanylate kinase [Dehalococcoidia bacterium]|nr:guanylate kinase [Dehalococcoidia bacterium]
MGRWTRDNIVVLITGPSGVGKDAVISKLKEAGRGDRHYSVTATTRVKRSDEKDGVDYFFLNEEQFRIGIANAEFLEWAIVYGNFYGVPKDQIEQALARKKDVIIKTDVQGAETLKRMIPNGVSIFVAPSTDRELQARLASRDSGHNDDHHLRLATAIEELERIPSFDYVVVNGDGMLDRSAEQVDAIIEAEKCKIVSL